MKDGAFDAETITPRYSGSATGCPWPSGAGDACGVAVLPPRGTTCSSPRTIRAVVASNKTGTNINQRFIALLPRRSRVSSTEHAPCQSRDDEKSVSVPSMTARGMVRIGWRALPNPCSIGTPGMIQGLDRFVSACAVDGLA